MTMRKIKCASLGLLFVLCSCVPNPDGAAIPIIPLGGSGGTTIRPAEPRAPSVLNSNSELPSERYEQHGAVDEASCYQMEARFRKEGRKVTLAKIVKNHFNKSGGVLEVMCLFTGEDAEIEPTVYEDYRYNSRDEYNHP